MRQIKDRNLAQLLMQLHFTPPKQRRKELEAAEKLFATIEKDKEYPFEFVCFRITGFHPRGLPELEPIKGDELAKDLHVFIAKLSGQVAQSVTEQNQKIYTIEELAEVIGISTKTIGRWRKRGLLARKFVFDDGKKRFGFLQSAVDEFLHENPSLAAKAKNFKPLTKKEKQQIIRQAKALAARTPLSRYQIIERVAAKTGRAHETIRYTLLNYEKAHPDKRISNEPPGVISQAAAAELYRLFKQGYDIKELMERFGRSKSSVYRIINRRRARSLMAKKVEFVDSDEFLEEDAEQKILAEPIGDQKPVSRTPIEPFDLANVSLLPQYLDALRDAPVLNRQREVELFRRYNYLKYLACINRAGIKRGYVRSARLTKIESCLAEAEAIKKMIIEANLRLVVSIAGKHATSEPGFLELVSKGNFALTKAVEEFNYTTGVRFSRLASLGIAKEYAKVSGKTTELTREKAGAVGDVQRYMKVLKATDLGTIERARQSLVQVIKDELDEREQYIILNHFGLVGPPVKKKKKTLQQIGQDLDLTKERVRQLELIALQKLRHSLSIEEFELLTG
ncbi:MAG: sigma-70 family RNA polymerase sigma factor [Planctomycetota bacterium]|jgi:RNA polymerase sigma factor (sigma-70 family)